MMTKSTFIALVATPALAAATALFAHCTPRPTNTLSEMPPGPESFNLAPVTVRRTDTAAPAAASAEPAAVVTATATSDAGSAASGDASAPAMAAAAPTTEAAPAETAAVTAMRTALDQQHAAIAQCYNGILAENPGAAGRMNVDINVTTAGVATRADVRVEGGGPLEQAKTCVETALRGAHFTGVGPLGAVLRRAYNFVNPAVDVSTESALRVQALARNAQPAAVPAPAAVTAPGVLSAGEVSGLLATATPALQQCYATTLRRSARAAGAGEVRFNVGADGAVTSATWGSAVEPIALMGECVGAAIRALHFRSNGTATNVRGSIEFAR